MSNTPEESARAGVSRTGDGDLAAIQMVLGCDPIEGAECDNIYSEAHPWESDDKPGKLRWNVSSRSRSFPGLTAAQIAQGYDDKGEIGDAFESLLDQIEDEPLRDQIKAKLPQVIASFSRGAFSNRRKIAGWWRGAVAWVLIKQGKKTFLMDRRAKGLAKKWGV